MKAGFGFVLRWILRMVLTAVLWRNGEQCFCSTLLIVAGRGVAGGLTIIMIFLLMGVC